MNTEFDKRSGQRRPILLVSGVVAVCLFVAALLERRRAAAASSSGTRAQSGERSATGTTESWASTSDVDTPVWEGIGLNAPGQWPAPAVADVDAPEPYDVEQHAEVEVEAVATPAEEPRVEVEPWQQPHPDVEAWQQPHVEVEVWRPEGGADEIAHEPEIASDVDEAAAETTDDEREAVSGPPAPAGDQWFGSFAPRAAWQAPAEAQPVEAPESFEAVEAVEAVEAEQVEHESVIELPPVDQAQPESDPKRLPPPRLRRFMGTGATILVLGLVLGAGVLASGATADSTSDPSTVPDAVGTTAPLADVVPDTTTTDTTTTDTTVTDTTSTDTTTTDTTTTPTTTTDTTTTPTTTTDTTSTTTTPDPTTTTTTVAPPPDPAPSDPPPSDPAATPADVAPPAPDASTPPEAPTPTVVLTTPPTPTVPVTPKAPVKPKAKKHTTTPTAPAKAKKVVSPSIGAPASSTPPVVTLAAGAAAIGSILSLNAAIPAVDASLLPTPAQVSFYVKASKPLPKLPPLAKVDHAVTLHLVTAGRNAKVGWTLLAAVSRLESNLGKKPGPLAGRNLPTPPTGNGLAALATFLHEHGAKRNPLTPSTARKALTLYFDGSKRKADRAIALAALYGALGPVGMQKGVRAATPRLQRRVLADHRVHLTVAGRSDIRHGRVDPRVLVTLEYLANSFHKVGVSDLVSGGVLFSRSGSVSAHLYGRAADVSSLHGKVLRGHQGPGTMTEQAVRKLLLLPKSLRPRQVISLMDVDGPTGNRGSFALPDHYDRIQINY